MFRSEPYFSTLIPIVYYITILFFLMPLHADAQGQSAEPPAICSTLQISYPQGVPKCDGGNIPSRRLRDRTMLLSIEPSTSPTTVTDIVGANAALVKFELSDEPKELDSFVQQLEPLYCSGTTTPSVAPRLYFPRTWGEFRTVSRQEAVFNHLASFFCKFPPRYWLRFDEQVAVFLDISPVVSVDQRMLGFLRDRFAGEFGEQLFVVSSLPFVPSDKIAASAPNSESIAGRLFHDEITQIEAHENLLLSPEFESLHRDLSIEAAGHALFMRPGVPDSRAYSLWDRIRPLNHNFSDYPERVSFQLNGPGRKAFWEIQLGDWYKMYFQGFASLRDHSVTYEFGHSAAFTKEQMEFTELLSEGISPDIIQAELLSSELFYSQCGNSPEIYLHRLFEVTQFRCPLPEEFNTWHQIAGNAPMDKSNRRRISMQFLDHFQQANGIERFYTAAYLNSAWAGIGHMTFNPFGAACTTFTGIPTLGPGLKQESLGGYPPSIQRYRESWKLLLSMDPVPPIVHIDSWNIDPYSGIGITPDSPKFIKETRKSVRTYFSK